MTIRLADIYRYCPRCAAVCQTPGMNPFRCDRCEFIYYFGPTVAVGGIVTDRDGQVLFIRRAQDPGKGKLGLPGGFVDAGEGAEEAMAREVLEEVNLRVTAMEYLASFANDYNYRGITLAVTDVFYVCHVDSLNVLRAAQDEVEGLLFCHPSDAELNNMAFESNRLALERFLLSGRNRRST
jgi:ADP-ribose pyrophosphatase